MNIRLTSGSDTLELSPQDSSLAALRHEGGNLLNGVQPLFRLKFRSGKMLTASEKPHGSPCGAKKSF